MQDKETTLVLKPDEAMPETASIGAAMDVAANIMAKPGKRHRLFSRGVVKQAIRRKREAKAAVVPGGGAKERARRLRQSAALAAKRGGDGHEDSSN